MKYTINYQDKEIEIERLPNGKFKIPPLGQFTKHGLGSTWLDDGRIPYESEDDKYDYNQKKGGANFGWSYQQKTGFTGQIGKGRFPANLLVSDDVLNDGINSKGSHNQVFLTDKDSIFGCSGSQIGSNKGFNDSGSFSRYFDLDAVARVKFPWIDDIANAYSNSYTFAELVTSLDDRIRSRRDCPDLMSGLYKQFHVHLEPASHDTLFSPSKLNTYRELDVPAILRILYKLSEHYAFDDSFQTNLLANEPLSVQNLKALQGFLGDYQEDSRLYDEYAHLAEVVSPAFLQVLICVHTQILSDLLLGAAVYKPDNIYHQNLAYSFLLSLIYLSYIIQEITGDVKSYFNVKQLPKSVQKTFPFLIVPKASKSEKNKGCEDLPLNKLPWGSSDMSGKMYDDGSNPIFARNTHPTVKPLKLMSYLIILGSREGDIILDPFMGTGTTGLACQLLNRDFIGYEINTDYFKIAEARLNKRLI